MHTLQGLFLFACESRLNQEKKAQKMLINKAFWGKGLAEKTRRKRGLIGRGYSGEILRSDLININVENNCLFSIDESDVIYGTFQFDSAKIRIEIENFTDGSYKEVLSEERVLISDGREEITSFYPGFFGINIFQAVQTAAIKASFIAFDHRIQGRQRIRPLDIKTPGRNIQ